MKKIAFTFIAAMAVLSFAGCKKKGGGAGEAMAKMDEFKKEMCACKDKACADGVDKKIADWSAKQPKQEGDKAAKMSDADTQKMAAIMKEMGDCRTKAAPPAEPPPPTPPPAGEPSATPPAGGEPGAAPPAGGTPAAGGDMKKEEPKKEEPKKEEPKK